jgi:TonB family protein
MKTTIKKSFFAPLILVTLAFTAYTGYFHPGTVDNTPELEFEVHGKYVRSVKKENLNKALLLKDVIEGYPDSWISEYISVEISGVVDNKPVKAIGENDTLTAKQIDLLHRAELGTDLTVTVLYKYRNAVTGKPEENRMNTTLTVIPDVEAVYEGGFRGVINYIKKKAGNKITDKLPKKFQPAIVRFTVSEEGKISDAYVYKSSGDYKTDKLLLEAVNSMPEWKPAEYLNGKKVKQEFQLSFGKDRGGC